jgi:hypothetical protein
MAKKLVAALGALISASPLSATILQPVPAAAPPPSSPATEYCLRVEPITGTRIGGIECLTREEWAEGDVDVDEAWAKDGVRVVG